MKRLEKIAFWTFMAMCISLVALIKTGGITDIVVFLSIMYVGVGGFLVGRQTMVSAKIR